MTNQDIINKLTSNNSRCTYLDDEEMNIIKSQYSKVPETTQGKFYRVCRKGSDLKYGQFYIDPVNKVWRDCTFNEFYGGGVVD